MKKLLSVVVLFMSALSLVACGSAKSELDGEYYEYYISSNIGDLNILDEFSFTIEDTTFKTDDGEVAVIDLEKKALLKDEYVVPYILEEDGTLVINGDRYVRKGSKKYNDIVSAIEKGEDSTEYKKMLKKIKQED